MHDLIRARAAGPSRRRILATVAAAASLGLPRLARAQGDFPNRPIRVVVPYSAGTGSDVVARLIMQSITEKTGKAFVVDNREGGGSLIGTLAVVKAPPDGYTLLIAANPMVIVPSQQANPPYSPVADFVPVIKVGAIPLVLTVSPALKINSVKELVAYAKAHPGALSYGSSGPGTISQQEMELFKQALGLDIPEIPYKSTAQAMTDLIGGTLSLFPVVIPLSLQHIQSGRAKALAVLDERRSPLLPEVPAVSEEPLTKAYSPTPVWYGFLAPAKTPAPVVQALAGWITEAMKLPEVRAKLQAQGANPMTVDGTQFALDIRTEYDKATLLARKLGTVKQ